MWEFKTYDYFRQIRCPVLLMPARPVAPLLPDEAEYLAYKESGVEQALQRIQGVQVQWMADTIHDIPLQRPGELAARLVDFARSIQRL
jgi:pimeloyl-ACP methyl ester carboxylesterase